MSVEIKIIGCPAWGALPSKEPVEWIGRAHRAILHHTAGHHAEIANPADESVWESIRYARDIQHFHMAPPPRGRGWNDSGHNFLICRNGVILQGRWRTIRAIQAGRMVRSAHCPGQNTEIGIENEHKGTESMTSAQRESNARLLAWIAEQYGDDQILPYEPHRKYFNTSCPVNLVENIPWIRRRALTILDQS